MASVANVVEPESLVDARVRIPQAVVYRGFAKETVLLNLDTGIYHGLNPSGGRMLETLDRTGSVREAARILADEYDHPLDEIETDLCNFCISLVERGLLVIDAA
jgi:hypothetical protein